MTRTNSKLSLLSFIFLLSLPSLFSQNSEKQRPEITAGTGLGINMAAQEQGLGIVYSIGWQQSIITNQRLRIHPEITFGGFRSPFFVSDTRDQFYRSSVLKLMLDYDLIKRNSGSIYLSAGGFGNYSRGLLGTGGGEDGYRRSEYFHSFYYGGSFSFGVRLTPEKSRLSYDLEAINYMIGNNSFIMACALLKIGFRIAK